ncbi:nucleotidyltransferase domain-containing protein [Pedobacter sp. L105]|uniref:nucleotidyltransferase domain-containing protein n=1 Tax=Pedobacter sp. L105 TaxID=1641871 RepID=UPI00131C9406|nr:nucleotidyltransferase domain-containing protein [Pedobacter sp. L105]
MPEIKEDILATLAYFDIFDYPLSSVEIYSFLRNGYDQYNFDQTLVMLIVQGAVYQFDQWYSLKNDYSLVPRRQKGNEKAAELIDVGKKVSDFLIQFPYVRGIAISGSLSKNYADEKSDIDLFIITARNRLWIARTLMHIFKKLTFLVNKQDYFCMNYYIDEQQLEILEKTTYTAIEIVTLITLHGAPAFEQFGAANTWTADYLPNKTIDLSQAKAVKNSLLKTLFEKAFNNAAGNAIDNALMKITAGRWRKKTALKKLNAKGSVMGMDANKHYAKPDPKNFQHKLLKQYDHKVADLLQDPKSSLAH